MESTLTISAGSHGGASFYLFACAAVAAFIGYPVAALYALSGPLPRERARRALTAYSAVGAAIVGLLMLGGGARWESAAHRMTGIFALVASASLLLLELVRRRNSQ